MMGPYERLPDWPARLAAVIRDNWDAPFDWGEHDCIQWTGKCVGAQSGFDPLERFRGTYSSPIGALKALKDNEQVRLPIDLADKWWGPRVHISRARMGDLVACDLGQPAGMGASVGICYGRNSLFVGTRASDSGLVKLETLTLEHCYQPWASSSMP